MIPYLLAALGGYLIGNSLSTKKYAAGGEIVDISKLKRFDVTYVPNYDVKKVMQIKSKSIIATDEDDVKKQLGSKAKILSIKQRKYADGGMMDSKYWVIASGTDSDGSNNGSVYAFASSKEAYDYADNQNKWSDGIQYSVVDSLDELIRYCDYYGLNWKDYTHTDEVFSKGGMMMADDGIAKEKITIKSYNIWGQEIKRGDVIVDYDNETIQFPSGKIFKVLPDREYTFKIQKTQIKASGGIKGLVEFIKEINTPDSPFNPSTTNFFIEL